MGEYTTDLAYIAIDQVSVRPPLDGQFAWLADHGWRASVICGKEDREAAAVEKPVAATRATGVLDAVVDGVTGLQSAIGEPQELPMNLVTLLTNNELAKKIERIARRRLEVEFSIERFSTGLESFYLNLCRERGLGCGFKNELGFTRPNMLHRHVG